MAEALVSLGTKVTIIEMADYIIPALDKEVSKTLRSELEKRGIKILTGAAIEKIEDRSGKLAAILKDGTAIEAEKALLSIGLCLICEGSVRLSSKSSAVASRSTSSWRPASRASMLLVTSMV